jgi:peptidoglycan hydrolase CwlO-like protein
MNASIDAELVNLVQRHVCQLSSDLANWTFETQEEMKVLKEELERNFQLCLQQLQKQVTKLQQQQSSTCTRVDVVEQRVTNLENQKCPGIHRENSYCEFKTFLTKLLFFLNPACV